MKRLVIIPLLLAAVVSCVPVSAHHRPGHQGGPPSRPSPSATTQPTSVPPTQTPSPTPSATASATASPSPSPTLMPTPSPTATSASGFVARSGTNLTLNGQPYRPVGTNAYNLASGWKTLWQCSYNAEQDLARQFNEMVNADLIRFWAFQKFATFNGQRNWEAFDRIIAEAKRTNKRLMFTFTDHWGACESQGGQRTSAWYVTGYKNDLRGDIATYRNYVAEVVARYKNEPQIAFWQLVNEAENCGGTTTQLRDFAVDMAGVIKAIDTNHVLSLGTIGGGQCGAQGADYKTLHNPAGIDVCEYHDYSDNAPIPGDQWNGMQVRINQCNELGKPLIVGEIGRIPDQVGGLQARSNLFKTKFDAWFVAGVDAAVVWNFHDSLHPDPPSSYGINAGDPIWTMLGGY